MKRSTLLKYIKVLNINGDKLNPYNPLTYLWIAFAIIEGFIKHNAIFIKEIPRQIKNSF